MTANRFQADGPADHVACQLASDGTVSGAPRAWLRAEAVVLLAGALAAYSTTGQPWWLVPALILLPDLAWAGYLGGTRVGAFIYNAAHATPLPAVMVGLGWWQHRPLVLALGLVWLAHIGLDHLLGYGLKYDDSFQHTHLGILGRRKPHESLVHDWPVTQLKPGGNHPGLPGRAPAATLITGSGKGLGYETARHLTTGHAVCIGVRDGDAGSAEAVEPLQVRSE